MCKYYDEYNVWQAQLNDENWTQNEQTKIDSYELNKPYYLYHVHNTYIECYYYEILTNIEFINLDDITIIWNNENIGGEEA